MLLIFKIIVTLMLLFSFSILIGFYYISRKQPDKDGYVFLNRRDIVFMIIFFPITICCYLFLKVLYIKDKLVTSTRYKRIHKWWNKPVKRI